MSNANFKPMVPAQARLRSKEVEDALAEISGSKAGQIVAKYLIEIETKNISVLSTDEAFRLIGSRGEIKSYKSALELSIADFTLVKLGDYKDADVIVSAQGYTKWAGAAGAAVFPPPTLVGIDGKPAPNPCPVWSKGNDKIIRAISRSVAFRFSSMGIPQVSDRTTIFDLFAYKMTDLIAKAKRFPDSFKLLPKGRDSAMSNISFKPNESGHIPSWTKYEFDESTDLWVDTSHKEALQWYSQIIMREKKALEFAQTFSQRNAIKHLSGIQKVPGNKEVWRFPVICWRPVSGTLIKWDMNRYLNAADSVMRLAEGDANAIEIEAGRDYADEGDLIELGQETSDESEEIQPTKFSNITPDQEEEPPPPGDRKFPSFQLTAFAQMEPDIYKQAAKECGLKDLPDTPVGISEDMAGKILRKINEIIDSKG